MKKFTTLLLAILMVLPAMAAEVNLKGGEVLYLTPNANWKKDNARFAMYLCNGSSEATWVDMAEMYGSGVYGATVPSGNYKNVILCRMNPNDQSNSWDTRWNQTDDLSYDATNNHYTVKEGTWDKGGGTWSKYTRPTLPSEVAYTQGENVVFFVNVNNWKGVNVWAWGNGFANKNGWPGDAMTILADVKVNGHDVYMFDFGGKQPTDFLFNYDGDTNKTADFTYTNGGVYTVFGYVEDAKMLLPENITAGMYYLVPGEWEDENVALYAAEFINKNTETSKFEQGYLNDHFVYFQLKEGEYTHVKFYQVENPNKSTTTTVIEDFATMTVLAETPELTYTAPGAGNIMRYNVDLSKWEEVEIGTGVNRVELAGGIGYAYGVVSAEGAIEVYNVNGAVVARGNDTIDLRGLGRGVYIIRNGNQVRKVVR